MGLNTICSCVKESSWGKGVGGGEERDEKRMKTPPPLFSPDFRICADGGSWKGEKGQKEKGKKSDTRQVRKFSGFEIVPQNIKSPIFSPCFFPRSRLYLQNPKTPPFALFSFFSPLSSHSFPLKPLPPPPPTTFRSIFALSLKKKPLHHFPPPFSIILDIADIDPVDGIRGEVVMGRRWGGGKEKKRTRNEYFRFRFNFYSEEKR